MFAPRLLVSPDVVDHGDRTPGGAPADGYTQRDIWVKGAGTGLAAETTQGATGCPAGTIVPARGCCYAWISRQVHARSTGGICEVHPGAGTQELRREASRGSVARSPTRRAARWSSLAAGRRLGKPCDVLRRATRPGISSSHPRWRRAYPGPVTCCPAELKTASPEPGQPSRRFQAIRFRRGPPGIHHRVGYLDHQTAGHMRQRQRNPLGTCQ
jgi:hypothetical protein